MTQDCPNWWLMAQEMFAVREETQESTMDFYALECSRKQPIDSWAAACASANVINRREPPERWVQPYRCQHDARHCHVGRQREGSLKQRFF